MEIQSVRDLAYKVANDPAFEAEMKADPVKAIANVAPPVPDTFVYKAVVVSLGATVLLTVIGAIVLVAIGKGEIPASIIALGSAAVGALAGLLAPAPSRS